MGFQACNNRGSVFVAHCPSVHARKPLAATLRAQIAAEQDAETAEKPNMPSYGTAVRCTMPPKKKLGAGTDG